MIGKLNSLYSKEHVKIIETHPGEISFVLRVHCQNLLDYPRMIFIYTFHIFLYRQNKKPDIMRSGTLLTYILSFVI